MTRKTADIDAMLTICRGATALGDTVDECCSNVREAIGLVLEHLNEVNEEIPKPTNINNIVLKENQSVKTVDFDFASYLAKYRS